MTAEKERNQYPSISIELKEIFTENPTLNRNVSVLGVAFSSHFPTSVERADLNGRSTTNDPPNHISLFSRAPISAWFPFRILFPWHTLSIGITKLVCQLTLRCDSGWNLAHTSGITVIPLSKTNDFEQFNESTLKARCKKLLDYELFVILQSVILYVTNIYATVIILSILYGHLQINICYGTCVRK